MMLGEMYVVLQDLIENYWWCC